jgi:nucleoside-diphosphate-sugar epimerase
MGTPRALLIFGLGYSGAAVARAALRAGFAVTGTSRTPARIRAPDGVLVVDFTQAAPAIAAATHVLSTVAPDADGDPVLARYHSEIAAAPAIKWLGYLSTTGVYGNRDGAWVDEDTPPAPSADRSARRLAAEEEWRTAAGMRPLDIMRVAGIYGPGRSALDDIRAGRARRVIKPGHAFGRIHRDDIAHAVIAAMRAPPAGTRILNLNDDEPAESADVIAEAARLLGIDPPPAVPFAQAVMGMSEMGRSFWQEDRRVSSAKTRAALGLTWLYPGYREGLRAILREESGERGA